MNSYNSGLVGFVKSNIAVIALFLIVALMLALPVFAGNLSSSVSPAAVEHGSANFPVNISANNNETNINITNVTIQLPTNLTYVTGSNATSGVLAAWFTNTSSNLSWGNGSTYLLGNQGNSTAANLNRGNFVFNVSVPTANTSLTIIVFTIHADGSSNSSSITLGVNDSTRPTLVDFVSPTSTSKSFNRTASPAVNVTYSEVNIRNCIFQWFNTSGNPGGINLTNSSGSGNSCSVTLSSQPEGEVNVTVFANDTAGNQNHTANRNWTIDSLIPASLNVIAPANNSNHTISYVFVNVTFNETNPDKCIFTWGNGSLVNFTNATSASGQNGQCHFNFTNQPSGAHNLSVYLNDSVNNTLAFNATFLVNFRPDFVVTDINYNSTDSNRSFTGSNITFIATIMNNASFVVSSPINISLFWDDAFSDTQFNVSAIAAGGLQNITFSAITSDTLVTNGRHTVKVFVDALNNVTEANETNNNFTEDFLVGYNVTVLNATVNQSLIPGSDINLNVTVRFSNLDLVTNMTQTNFTLFDNFTVARNLTTITGSIKSFDGQFNLTGVYIFNVTIPGNNASGTGKGQPGNHDLIVQVNNGTYSGNGTMRYNISAPNLTLSFSGLSATADLGGESSKTDSFTVDINNTGNIDIINVTITLSGATLSVTSCTIHNLTVGNANTSCVSVATYSTTDDKTITASAGGFVSSKSYNDSISKTVDVSDSGGGSTGSSGGSTGADTSNATCSSNADCASNKHCSGGTCVLLSCGSDEIISNHQCIKNTPKPQITDAESSIDIVAGQSKPTEVVVKNTGVLSGEFNLSISISGIQYSVSPSSCSLDVGGECTFTVTLITTNDTNVKSYSGTFRAFVSSDSSIYTTSSFTVNVLPTEEGKQDIVEDFANLSQIFNALVSEFNSIKSSVPPENISAVGALINKTNETLEEIKALIQQKDFVRANEKITDLRLSLEKIRDELDLVGGSSAGGFPWFWIMIIVIVIGIVGFLVYLFMPSRGQGGKIPKPSLPGLPKITNKTTDDLMGKMSSLFKKSDKTAGTTSIKPVRLPQTAVAKSAPAAKTEKTQAPKIMVKDKKNIPEPIPEPEISQEGQKYYNYQYDLGKKFKGFRKKR